MATIAVFLALGGISYAALKVPKNSVGSKQLKKNAVTTAKIKKEAVTGAKVKKGSLTGRKIDASTLGMVPSAQTAQTANSIAAPEPWNVVGAPGEPLFQNGCHDYGYGSTPVGFYKDHEGEVHLQGVYVGCSSISSVAFQLPPDYRPRELHSFPMAFAAEPTGITVFPTVPADSYSGAVLCNYEGCILDGITFRAES